MTTSIKGFTVGYYKSITEPRSLSFMATSDTHHPSHVLTNGVHQLLKYAFIFSRDRNLTSDLLSAIRFSRHFIVSDPLLLKFLNTNTPAVFQYDLIIDNQEYLYGLEVSLTTHIIQNEWLTRVYHDHECDLFNRTNDHGIIHIESNAFHNYAYKNLNHHKTFLFYLAERKVEDQPYMIIIRELMRFFENGMIFDTVIDHSSHKLIILDHPDPLLIQKVLAQQLGQWLVLTKQTSFLHLDILRQDEIWFCERSRNIKLYSLNKFRIHDHDDIQKDYIIGRYHL